MTPVYRAVLSEHRSAQLVRRLILFRGDVVRRWFTRIVLMLAIVSLGTASMANERDETGEKLGPLKAPQGGKAYRVTWHGYWSGFVEASVDADGQARIREGDPGQPTVAVSLQPGDLLEFEAELAHSPFAATVEHQPQSNCLDDCSYYFLTVATDGFTKTVPVEPVALTVEQLQKMRLSGATSIGDAADELIQIARARSGDFSGRPGPWWTRDGATHPYPALPGRLSSCKPEDLNCSHQAWRATLKSLGLSDLWAAPPQWPEESFYRIIWFSPTRTARAMLVVQEPSHCGIVAKPIPEECKEHASISTALQQASRPIEVPEMDRFVVALYRAGFSTVSPEPAISCGEGDVWVLEAYLDGRYRYVTGSACDERGLHGPVTQLRSMAGWR
jgi:hypothetical protein